MRSMPCCLLPLVLAAAPAPATTWNVPGEVSTIAAAVDSAAELRIPLLISSLTTIAAFLPIYLAESDTGEYTAHYSKW